MVGAKFTTPILRVSPDAVRDLEGHEALLGLWTIITKCKGCLPNGVRLENITWRLWHRQLAFRPPSLSPSSTNFPTSTQESTSSEDAFSEVCPPPHYALPPSCPSRSFSDQAMRSFSTRPIGEIICDFLPCSGTDDVKLALTRKSITTPVSRHNVDQSLEPPTNAESSSGCAASSISPERSDNARDRSGVKGNQSRSRSRDRSGNPFAELSGIGTLGGYTIAAAYPPPNMAVRKQVVVGAGKGKVKVALGRTHNGRSKAVRRNSAGAAPDAVVKETDKGLERVKSLEDILETPVVRQHDLPQERTPVFMSPTAATPRNLTRTDAGPTRPIQSFKQSRLDPTSDEVGSKRPGSGASLSGDHGGNLLEDSQGPRVMDSLGDPLLPKGRPVVVDSDSDYETDTEEGSWSDQEVVDETEMRKQEQIKQDLALQKAQENREAERQEEELRQMHLQQQQQHFVGRPPVDRPPVGRPPVDRPPVVQRTQSSHYPGAKNKAVHRARQQQIHELALHHAKLEQAAKEAQRQRDMIKKLPRESFQDLAKARANSVGLLTQLLNPEIFPPGQPIAPSPLAPMQPTTSDPGPSAKFDTADQQPLIGNPQQFRPMHHMEANRPPPRRHMSTVEGKRRMPSLSNVTSPIRGPPMPLTKGSAALPVSSQVRVGSICNKVPPSAAITSSGLGNTTNLSITGSGGYRKGPPKGQEMEEDSDSEPETGKIQMSKSIAEQKLKALAEKRGIKTHPIVQPQAGPSRMVPPGDEDVPEWARVSQLEREPRPMNGVPIPRPPPSAPIPFGHPYNLPPAAPPTTPRTTRRQMLATELSESLRRNLLWERQVSKNNLAAMRRSSSSAVNRHDGLGRLQPFTSIAPVVQLHAKGTIPLDQQEDPSKRAVVPLTEAEREERKRYAIARNRSWANEFHFAGW